MRRSQLTPALLVAVLLLAGALAWLGYQWFAARQAAAAERQKILEGVAVELQREPLDSSELSQLMARIRKLDDHASAPDLLAAQARIELARGRPERAADLFVPIASRPGAAPEEQGLAARILLRWHASGLRDRGAALGVLEQVVTFATNAHAASEDPADLLGAWLAATRLGDGTRSGQLADRLLAEHPGSPAAQLADTARRFTPAMGRGPLDDLRAQFDEPPPEIDTMLALALLQAGALDEACRVVEPLLVRAAGVVEARWAAAIVFHACALGSPAGAADRTRWLTRRDAQLDWLLEHGAPDDPRRPRWAAMRGER